MLMFAHLTHLMLSLAPFANEIFCASLCSYKIMLFLCLPTTPAECTIIPQPQEQKSGRRQLQCSSTLYECLCNQLRRCYILQPYEQNSCRRQTQYSNTLCRCLCNQPILCCPLQPFQMRYFVVCTHIHFKSLKCVLCVSLHCGIPVGLQD